MEQDGTNFNLNVTKREGDTVETVNVSSSNVEQIRQIIDKFATVDMTNTVDAAEYQPYGEGSVDITMQDMADNDDDCECGGDKGVEAEFGKDGNLRLAREDLKRLQHLAGMMSEDEEESGRGRYKVNYVHPDKKKIGNDRFETEQEAKKYKKDLEKKGYHDVNVTEDVNEDADYDYRDEDNGPNKPTDYDYDHDFVDYGKKGHPKKGNKVVNNYGDNPMADPDEESTMFENMMKEWKKFKLNEAPVPMDPTMDDPMNMEPDMGMGDPMDMDPMNDPMDMEPNMRMNAMNDPMDMDSDIGTSAIDIESSSLTMEDLEEALPHVGGKIWGNEDQGDTCIVYVMFASESKKKEAEAKLAEMGFDIQTGDYSGSGMSEICVSQSIEEEM